MSSESSHDLVVIGSGPAGQKAALTAAKLGKTVALIDRREVVGGVCLHTGTIPSKTLRESVLYFTGHLLHSVYGESYRPKDRIGVDDLNFRVQHVIRRELDTISDQMRRNGVEMVFGKGRFENPHRIEVLTAEGGSRILQGGSIIVAPGTVPARPSDIPFTEGRIFDSDGILRLENIPRSMTVVGAGVIGSEYASIYATLGVEVTIIDGRERILEFADREIIDELVHQLRTEDTVFRLGEKVSSINLDNDRVVTQMESGKRVVSETLLYSVGRQGATADMGLQAAGLQADSRGRLSVDAQFRTTVPHIFAVGDVIGFPSLASTSMEQGRQAACYALEVPVATFSGILPYGIYTIPEMSMVGKTEQTLTEERVPYETGVARYAELAKAQMLGDDKGMLKLLFHRDTRALLGVHIIGARATELIHVGQAVLAFEGTIDYFIDTVFNYPTLAEAYKVAAYDGINKL